MLIEDADDFRRSRTMLPTTHPPLAGEGGEMQRAVANAIADSDGLWRSCTGCHELNEGHDTGPYSEIFRCALGNGCGECGGLGVIWDTTDYGAMAEGMMRNEPALTSPQGTAGTAGLSELIDDLEHIFSGAEDIDEHGGPNDAMRTMQIVQRMRAYMVPPSPPSQAGVREVSEEDAAIVWTYLSENNPKEEEVLRGLMRAFPNGVAQGDSNGR